MKKTKTEKINKKTGEKPQNKKPSVAKAAFISTIPVMAGYIVLGIAFGILLHDNGYSVWWAVLMSTTMYAGSMQFVAVGLLSGGASLVSAAIMTLLVNARHLIYGISMLEKYRGTGKAKLYLMFSLTDETYALLCGNTGEYANNKKYFLLVSLFDQIYWIVGGALGGLIGSAITFDTKGIDFAMTALFIVIFTEQWLSSKKHLPAIIGVGVTVLCLVIFGKQNFLIPSMIIIVFALSVIETVMSRKGREHNE